MPRPADFDLTFARLKEILKPYEKKLIVVSDTDKYYGLETPHVLKNKHRLFFGGVRKGKAYVSFHLMPVYVFPGRISPELKKRMQGKSCFNFIFPDEKLFKELARLTKAGFKTFTSKDFYSSF
ncbi:MAG: hypothetical protein ABR555_06120 [Pyrinomonadaceae bacterium]